MPIYEYRCNGCRRRTSVFTRSISAAVSARCQHCGSEDLSRLISRVAVLRPEGDSGSDFPAGGADEDDPRSVARWVRRMSREMGEPLEPEMEANLERLEAGENLDDFEDGGGDDGEDFDVS